VLKGTIAFKARLTDSHLLIPKIEIATTHAGIERIEIESTDGSEVDVTVHLGSAATENDAEARASQAVTALLDHLSFRHSIAIDKAQKASSQFVSLDPNVRHIGTAEGIIQGQAVVAAVGLGIAAAAILKADLEQRAPAGERMFGSFRAALQSGSSVEQFLHLYHILMMLMNDKQGEIDKFIQSEQPTIPHAPRPDKPHINETVYTRLRNEFAHNRPGVNLDQTKREMADRTGGLVVVTRRAIERYA
jgi:hypothetical protein